MQRLRTVTSLDVSAVAGHHAMPGVLLFLFPRLKKHFTGRKYQTLKNLVSAIFQCLNSISEKIMKMHVKIGLKDRNFVYHMVASILKD